MDQLQQLKEIKTELHVEKEQEINSSQQINQERFEEKNEQKDLNESFLSENFQEVLEERDHVQKVRGNEPDQPKYIGMDQKYTKTFGDGEDSPKMVAVREALDKFYNPDAYHLNQRQAAEALLKACDKYCSGRFEIFKRGRGLKRLQEVKALREQALQRLDYLEQHSDVYIARNDEDNFNAPLNEMMAGVSLGKKIVAGVATFFGFTIGNLAKIVALQPLWGKEAFRWRMGEYYYGAIRAQDRLFGRMQMVDGTQVINGELVADPEHKVKRRAVYTSTSLKNKEKSKTFAKENEMIKNDIERYVHTEKSDVVADHPAILDEGFEDYEALKNLKGDIIEEFKKDKPDFKKIKKLEEQMTNLELDVRKFAKEVKEDYPNVDFNMNELEQLEKELYHARIQKVKMNERKVDISSGGMLANIYANDAFGSSVATSELIKKKWIENGEIPEKELDELIKDTFEQWQYEGEVQSEEEKKRIKERVKERFQRSILAAKTYQQRNYLLEDDIPNMPLEFEMELKSQSSNIKRDIHSLFSIDKTRTVEEKVEFLKEFTSAWTYKSVSDMTEEEKAKYLEEKKQGQKKQAAMLKPMIEAALSITDFKKYNVDNDDDLMTKYYVFRDELNYGFVLSGMTDEYVKLGGELTDEEYRTIKATAKTLQSIFLFYENRMTFLRNPYYFLADDEILKGMTKKEIEDRIDQVENGYDNTAYKKYLDSWLIQREDEKISVTEWDVAVFHGNDVESAYNLSMELEKKKERPKQ